MNRFKNFFHPIQFYRTLSVPARAGIWFLICNVLQKGMSAITTPIFTRLLTTSEYGDVSTFYAWADLLSVVITFGLSSTVYSRGLVKNDSDKKRYTTVVVSLSIVTTIISYTVYFSLHSILNSIIGLSLSMMTALYVYTLFNTVTEFWYQEKRVFYEYKKFVLLTLFLTIIKPVISIIAILLFQDNKIDARILSEIIIVTIVGAILLIPILFNKSSHYDKEIWKESMLFVLPLIPHYLSQRVLSQSDRIMIKVMVGSSEAGIYSLAYSVGMLLTLLHTAINNTLGPWAFRKMKENDCRAVGMLCEQLLIFFGLCVVSFSLIAPEMVKIFASEEYYEAIYIVPIIALSAFFMFMYVLYINFEYYSGKTQFVMIATILSAVINLMLNYVFIPIYGYIAAAYTTLFCYILYALGHYFIMKYICEKFMNAKHVFNSKYILLISVFTSSMTVLSLVLYRTFIVRVAFALIFIAFTMANAIYIVNKFGRQNT